VLRLQNVYGPGQSLTNSYTGIVALFARLARTQPTLDVYEDGRILRDFVYIDDVVEALFAAIGRPATRPRCLDIGSGVPTTIHQLAKKIALRYDAPEPVVVGKFRDGDIRAARCDIEAAVTELDWRPQRALEGGLGALLGWIDERIQGCSDSGTEAAQR
jgi:dTDP-L-rhamnose 4-epimerase